jgi:hypothetical protein
VTFETETARDCTRALRALIVLFIVVVAIWASTGGLDRMLAEQATSALSRPI